MNKENEFNRPKYKISVLAKMLDVHPQTIRSYERMGFVKPNRSAGNTRLFSDSDREIMRKIQTLTKSLGVNLAGVEIILRMTEQINNMNKEASRLFEMISEMLNESKNSSNIDLGKLLKECQWLNLDEKL